ncbi:MAG: hypothetical protein ACKV0T_20870 [Planctomycetales bacterium]
MKWRWPSAAALGVVACLFSPAAAGEPYLQFVKGLRDREYYDTALLYLDQIEERGNLPPEIKQVLPFERAVTLLEGARATRNPEAQGRQFDQARGYLEQFLQANPQHPLAAQANTELAQVYLGKGRMFTLQSRSTGKGAQKEDLQKQARAQFVEAGKVYQAAHDRFREEYEKYDKFIPKTEKARYEARESAYVNWIQAQLNLALLQYENAQSFDKGSAENKELLTEASKAFDQIHARHRTLVAGLHARMWQGKCFEEQDDITKAMGIYEELLDHSKGAEKPTPPLKHLQDRVLVFKLICLNHDQRKDYALVRDLANAWIKENRPALSTRAGLGIQWELVRAMEMLSRREETPAADRTKLLQQALTTARSINRYQGEFKDVSTAMIQRLMLDLDREPGDPKDFSTAFGIGRNLIDDIKNRNKAIDEARGAERDRLVADLQPTLKEAARIFSLALSLASRKDDEKEINRARYFLSYVYFRLGDYSYDSAILAEFVARKYHQKHPDQALEAAFLAQAAYTQAFNRAPEASREPDLARILSMSEFITNNWPDSDKAQDARMSQGALFTQMRRPAEAARWYLQVPESAPQYLEAQLAAGNAFWFSYLDESIRPEAERPPKEQLDGLLSRSREILQSALTRFEAQLPPTLSQVDSIKLANLTRAKYSYAQILNGSGDFPGALAQLVEGPLSVVAAVAPPEGDERQRPHSRGSIQGREFAGIAHQQVLRAYVGTQNLDKARAEMKELEKIEGAGGGAAMTQISLQLGKELEKEVKRLQTSRDSRLNDVLSSFETFLDDMSTRKEGQDYSSLKWVADTYVALGEGLESGDPAKATSYFSKGVAALQQIIDAEKNSPGFVPSGALTGVQLLKVAGLRRQQAFDEALRLVTSILKQRTKALDAQVEAARIYQDWAARGGPNDRGKWSLAINGDQRSKKKKPEERVIWGWFGIAQRLEASLLQGLETNSEHEQQYLDARYNVAWCRLQDALSQSTRKKREPLLDLAKRDIIVTASLSPELGGGATWEKFNNLYRTIQKEQIDSGIVTDPIVDLEKRARPTTADRKGSKTNRKSAAKKTSPTSPGGSPAEGTEKAAPTGRGGNVLGWVLLVLAVFGSVGYGVYRFRPGQRKASGGRSPPQVNPESPARPKSKTAARSRP